MASIVCLALDGGGSGVGRTGRPGAGAAVPQDVAARIRRRTVRQTPVTRPAAAAAESASRVLGKAVQLDPIKTTLKARGIKLLKLKYDKPL